LKPLFVKCAVNGGFKCDGILKGTKYVYIYIVTEKPQIAWYLI